MTRAKVWDNCHNFLEAHLCFLIAYKLYTQPIELFIGTSDQCFPTSRFGLGGAPQVMSLEKIEAIAL